MSAPAQTYPARSAVERRAGFTAPEWLRTYGGTWFLPATIAFPAVIFERGGAFWIVRPGGQAQPLQLADDADVRDLHPGLKLIPDVFRATGKQARLLRRLMHPRTGQALVPAGAGRPSKQLASEMLAVHFASSLLDGGEA